LVICLIPLSGTKAQTPVPIKVSEDTLSIGNSSMPAMVVNIPEAQYEKVLKDWKKSLESGTKSKVIIEDNKMSLFGARLKMFENPVNVYSTISNQDDGLNLKTAVEISRDKYIDRDNEFSKLRDFMFTFAKEQYIEIAEEQLKAEDQKLKELQKELSAVDKGESKSDKEGRDNREIISTEKTRLGMLNNQLQSVSADLIESGNQASGMGSSDAQKNYVKDLEKQQKKIQKDIQESEKKISEAEKELENAEKGKPGNDSKKDAIREKITAQEAVVKQYEDKLKAINEFK